MEVLSLLRKKAFWILDYMRGSLVKDAYNDIKKIDELDSSDDFISKYQKEAWKELKEKACSKTRAYAPYANSSFFEFPMITKQDIRNAQEDFLSVEFNKDELIQMSTSGSTGTPFVCYQNSTKKCRVNAEVIYYSEKVGYKLGENLSYIRTIVKQNKKSNLKQFIQNQSLINCGQLSDEGIERILRSIQRESKKGKVTLLAYGSTYTALKDYILKHNIKNFGGCNVKGIISGSDMLFDETREVVSNAFDHAVMVSRYSNEENGVIGQDEGINNVFVINEADYIVEILDENAKTVPEGTLGRIVVTDLFNYAMPMIRYDTGDMGAIQTFDINGKRKKCICQFSGRRVDVIFDADGNALSPHAITNAMWDFPDILQFQLIQVAHRTYKLKLNVPDSFKREKQLLEDLKQVLGENALVEIQRVNEIPVLASGKRRYIVNEWKK